MVGFDDGTQQERVLDGISVVASINPDLTTGANVTTAARLAANSGISFMADTKGGPFDVSENLAVEWLQQPNPHGRPNSDVLRPWLNGRDVASRQRNMWIVDFPIAINGSDAAMYERVFEHLRATLYHERRTHRTPLLVERWWQHERPRQEMRAALAGLPRFMATVAVAKHRLFVWMHAPTLPDHSLIVFARDDDYTLGVLHSRVHEKWARSQGSQLRDAESGFRYTPTSTFETFPFPEPTAEQRQTIAVAARELDAARNRWLNPPEWLREESLIFPASPNGPWAHLVENVGADGIGTAVHLQRVPIDDAASKKLMKRTLTALYNEKPTWLRDLHRALDEAVFAAYGLAPDVSDERILSFLLKLNLERVGSAPLIS